MSRSLRANIARLVALALVAPAVSIAIAARPAAAATTINVPSDHATIQAAIDAASNGDTVVVAPGTYHERIDFTGKNIEVKSSAGPATTIIDGDATAGVVTFKSGETSAAVLRGFTIQNGVPTTGPNSSVSDGAGIRISNASPLVIGNVIQNNDSQSYYAAGIGIFEAAPTIKDNVLQNNCSGSAIYGHFTDAVIEHNIVKNNLGCSADIAVNFLGAGTVTVTGNVIEDNAAGLLVDRTSTATISNNVIQRNAGGGIGAFGMTTFAIVQNVVVGNTGGGIDIEIPSGSGDVRFVNNTVADNTSFGTPYRMGIGGFLEHTVIANNIIGPNLECGTNIDPTPPTVLNNNLSAASGSCTAAVGANGNISADPHFLDAANSDYHLQFASPSLDAGTNAAPSLPATDLDGNARIQNSTVDQGAYEYTPTAPTPTGEFTSLTPARLLDTRPGFPTVDGQAQGIGAVGEGASKDIQITGRGGVPAASQVSAVVLNATVADPTASSFLTIWPTGLSRPTISNLNYVPGQVVPNLVTVGLGTGGKVSVYNRFGNAHVIFDVVGYYSTATGPFGSRFHGVTPFRFFDTRNGAGGVPAAKVGQGGTLKFKVTGKGGVPASGVTAVVMNVTITEPDTSSFATVYPDDVARPNASNLNYVPGLTVPNLVEVRVPASGIVDFYNHNGATHLLADVVGYYDGDKSTEGGRFVAVAPFRRFDSRVSSPFPPPGKILQGNTLLTRYPGYQGLLPSAGIGSVVTNVTVTEPDASSFITAFPPDGPLPVASNLNFVPGQTVPNLVIVRVSSGPLLNGITTLGWIGHFNRFGNTHLVIDVFGYFTASFTDVVGLEADDSADWEVASLTFG